MAASANVRVLVQRVSSARVVVDGDVVGEIRPDGQGLLAFVGVTHADDREIAKRMAEKLWRLRILDGEASAADVGAPVLVVSQFTLHASTNKGTRPSWHRAARPEVAIPLYEAFLTRLHELLGKSVPAGVFGAHMSVSLVNDGPVTIIVDSKLRE